MKNIKNNSQGFSLIEILVVLLIIGLLTTLVVVNVLPSQDKARIEKAKADISILENALEMYRLDNYKYPTTEQSLKVLVTRSLFGISFAKLSGTFSITKTPSSGKYNLLTIP